MVNSSELTGSDMKSSAPLSKTAILSFISADFELDSVLIDKVVNLCKCDRDAATVVNIQRRYDGKYLISFPNYKKEQSIDTTIVTEIVSNAATQLGA